MATSLGTYVPSLAFLNAIVQDNTLVKEFQDALYPRLLFRREASVERWGAQQGDAQIFTRSSLLAPVTSPITPGNDPTPKAPRFEQWRVIAAQYTDRIDTPMPADWAALASVFLRNAKTLGLQSAQSLNRLARSKLFAPYCSGDTLATALGSATTSLPVASIAGFTETMVDGRLVPVSVSAPKAATLGGVGAVSIVGASPASSSRPFGPGTLTLAASATWAANARVLASDAPAIVRAGAATSVDGLTAASALKFAEIRRAVAIMERNNVPKFDDGTYHCHLDPVMVSQLYADNEFQRSQQEGQGQSGQWKDMALAQAMGVRFYSNQEAPNVYNSAPEGSSGLYSTGRGSAVASPEFHAEVRNSAGVGVSRGIIMGKGSLMEAWIDEKAAYMTAAGALGKIGEFSITNNGIMVEAERIRYIIRTPIDVLQQIVTQAWSWSGDFGVPSDLFGGLSASLFKRCVVLEAGTED